MAPASAAWIRPSAKGKKASDAQAEPLASDCGRPASLGRLGGADGGDAGGVAPVHLAGADAAGLAVLGEDDGVGLDVLGDGEGEQHVAHLGLGRRALGDDLQVGGGQPRVVAALHQEAAGDRLEGLARRSGSGRAPVTSRRRFFAARRRSMASSSASGAITTSVKILTISRGGGRVQPAVHRDDAAEGRDRIALQRALVGLFRSSPRATPQGLACLMMAHGGAGGRIELGDQLEAPRRCR